MKSSRLTAIAAGWWVVIGMNLGLPPASTAWAATGSGQMELAADFGDQGEWLYDGGPWSRTTSWNPESMVSWQHSIATDFGVSGGLWLYDTTGWKKVSSWSPYAMTSWGTRLAAAFDGGRGLWLFDGAGWTKTTSWEPVELVAWGDRLAAAFGAGRGLWVYQGATWSKISSWDPEQIIALNGKIAADFGPGRGIWIYEAPTWSKISLWDPYDMVAWDTGFVAAFDSGRGLSYYDGSVWRRLTTWEPERVVSWHPRLAVDFGVGRGIWLYESSRWRKITDWDPSEVVADDVRLVAAFGAGRGIWSYDVVGWKKLTDWDPEGMEVVDLTDPVEPEGVVYYVSTAGDDLNDGLSPDTPWRSLAHAESQAQPGSVVALRRGDVFEMATALGIHHGGSAADPITWDGALWGEGPQAVIRSISDREAPEKAVVNIIGCQYVTFQNITVDGNGTNAFGIVVGGTDSYYSAGGVQDSETGIIIQDCQVLSCGEAHDDYVIAVLIQTWNNDMSNIVFRRNLVDGAANHTVTAYCGREEHGATPSELTGLYIGYNTVTNFGINGQDRASGISMTQTVTGGVIEHNTVTQGERGTSAALVVAGNVDGVPTDAVIRYNDVKMTDKPALVIQNGLAPSADVYGNLFYVENASSAAVWMQIAPDVGYEGASFQFFNNTIVVGAGVGYMDDTTTAGVSSFFNNIVINQGPGTYSNPCYVANQANSSAHSHNACYRTEPGDVVYAIEADVGYVFRSQALNWEPTSVIVDPELVDVNGFDWHLNLASPVIGKGLFVPGLLEDFDGQPFQNPPSMGAYEVH